MVLIELTNCCVTQQSHSEPQLLRCCVYYRSNGIIPSFPLPISTITSFYCSSFKLMNTNFYIHVWFNIISNLLHESVYCIAISLMRNSRFLLCDRFLQTYELGGHPTSRQSTSFFGTLFQNVTTNQREDATVLLKAFYLTPPLACHHFHIRCWCCILALRQLEVYLHFNVYLNVIFT